LAATKTLVDEGPSRCFPIASRPHRPAASSRIGRGAAVMPLAAPRSLGARHPQSSLHQPRDYSGTPAKVPVIVGRGGRERRATRPSRWSSVCQRRFLHEKHRHPPGAKEPILMARRPWARKRCPAGRKAFLFWPAAFPKQLYAPPRRVPRWGPPLVVSMDGGRWGLPGPSIANHRRPEACG